MSKERNTAQVLILMPPKLKENLVRLVIEANADSIAAYIRNLIRTELHKSLTEKEKQ